MDWTVRSRTPVLSTVPPWPLAATTPWRPLVVGLLLALALTAAAIVDETSPRTASVGTGSGKPPLTFVPNGGQTDPDVRYQARGAGFSFFFTDEAAVLAFQRGERGHALELRFVGANPAARPEVERRAAGTVNYISGSERHVGLPTYERLVYRDLWPGIDMVFRGPAGKLKYEFVLAPGADPSDIRLAYAGTDGVSLGAGGALAIDTPLGRLRDARPVSYQTVDGRRVAVESSYTLAGSSYGFTLGSFNRARPLVIDPGLAYSTFLGGAGGDQGLGAAVDAGGSVYVSGATDSTDFPITAGSFDSSRDGDGSDSGFITKLAGGGPAIAYSTYFGGNPSDQYAIAVDGSGSVYVTGYSLGPDFPPTPGAFDTSHNGEPDVLVAKLDPTGSTLVYATYLGGGASDQGYAIAVDGSGSAYVIGTTTSLDFPTSPGAFDTTLDGFFNAFVSKLDPTGSSLDYSTYLSGASPSEGFGIAVDGGGSAYVTGTADSADFPATVGAFDPSYNGINDAVLAKLDATGSNLVFATYLGGTSSEFGGAVALDAFGSAYVTGLTNSADFPIAGGFDTSQSADEVFVTKLSPTGSTLVYSTYLGGSLGEEASAIAVDGSGSAYVVGNTLSSDFPTVGAFDTTYNGSEDAFLTKLSPTGSSIAHSTYLGGASEENGEAVVVDPSGNSYAIGTTHSADFPTPGGFDSSLGGFGDAFVVKISGTDTDPDGDGIHAPLDTSPGTASNAFADGATTSGSITDRAGLNVTITDVADPDGVRITVGAGAGQVTLSVCGGFTLKVSAGSEVVVTCSSVTVTVVQGSAQVVLGGGRTVVSIPNGVTAKVTSSPDGSFAVDNLGGGVVTVNVDGVQTTIAAGASKSVRTWDFQGFTPPVDNPPTENVVKAGQAVPLKWRLVAANGTPVTTLSTAHMNVTSLACSLGTTTDQLEEVAPGGSGLRNLGNGNYQLNWKTPTAYARSCKALHLDLGEGVTRDALFRFTK